MNLRAIQDRVILKAQEVEKETSGGIIIANASNEGIIQGTVLSIGPGTYDEKGKFVPTTTNVGNTVLFNLLGATTFKHEEEEFVTITEKEIIAIVS